MRRTNGADLFSSGFMFPALQGQYQHKGARIDEQVLSPNRNRYAQIDVEPLMKEGVKTRRLRVSRSDKQAKSHRCRTVLIIHRALTSRKAPTLF